jgi:hypothetical protein
MAAEPPPRAGWRGRRALIATGTAVLLAVAADPAFTVVYANSTAARQDAAAKVQDKTIAKQDAQARVQAATIAQLRRQLLASCNAAADLGTVPLPAKPLPSRLAVKIVTDNRAAWYGNGCPGTLPVPAGLAAAAARYGIPVNGKAPDAEVP